MSLKRSRLGNRSRNTTMIVTHTNCQNCVKVMPVECDFQTRKSGHWGASLESVIGEEGTRSHLVEVNRKYYRRNRKWLRGTSEELPESVETNLDTTDPIELFESSPAQPPHTEGRPVRDRCPPVWLKDYECSIKTLTLLCAFFYFVFFLLCIVLQGRLIH